MCDDRKIIYLACPYSHEDPEVREARFRRVNKAAAAFFHLGHLVFSPISHSHPMVKDDKLGLVTGFSYWRLFDEKMISVCSALIVLCLPGWDSSVGVKHEIEYATSLGLRVAYIFEEDLTPEIIDQVVNKENLFSRRS